MQRIQFESLLGKGDAYAKGRRRLGGTRSRGPGVKPNSLGPSSAVLISVWRSAIVLLLFPFSDVGKKLPQSLSPRDAACFGRSVDARGPFDRARPTRAIDRPLKGIEPEVTLLHLYAVVLMFRLLAHALACPPRQRPPPGGWSQPHQPRG